MFPFSWQHIVLHTLNYKFLTAHSPSTLLKVVRDTEYAEKGITYRLKPRIAGIPIISNWDKWKALMEKINELIFSIKASHFLLSDP